MRLGFFEMRSRDSSRHPTLSNLPASSSRAKSNGHANYFSSLIRELSPINNRAQVAKREKEREGGLVIIMTESLPAISTCRVTVFHTAMRKGGGWRREIYRGNRLGMFLTYAILAARHNASVLPHYFSLPRAGAVGRARSFHGASSSLRALLNARDWSVAIRAISPIGRVTCAKIQSHIARRCTFDSVSLRRVFTRLFLSQG